LTVDVAALTDDIFRVGVFPDGMPVEYRSEAVIFDREPSGDASRIRVQDGKVSFEAYGRVFAADADGVLPFNKVRAEGERYFGCGERTAGLEKTGSHQVFWNVDPPEGHTASFNNLYTSIPFVLSLVDGRAHGLFLDYPGRVEFDLAKADPARFTATADGPLVYYVFAGPTPRDVLAQYTELTGRISLPPLWALGNQQSKWGYADAEEVRAIARGYRERGIPCDVVYLDIDHMDGYRVFTFDPQRFPDAAGFVAELEADGFKVVCITDPGVKVDEDYGVYVSGRDRDLYCKTKRGTEYRNVVWPGLCAFPDFTNPEAREWWGDQQAPLVEAGVAGVWCDMDEPALFVPDQSTMPDDVVHPGGGEPRYHKDVHNLYGSLMARAAREGLQRLRPDRRPFVITRAGYAGLQRDALQWTGDNSSWWEHLWMSMPQLQNLGLSGVSFCGVDVGGFFGDSNGELLARWTEFGIFQPFCRNHSCKGTVPQEPWAFGEPWETVCRDMLSLRMRLLPYLYGLFDEAARTGAPILRPLLFEYPDDPVTYSADDEFLVGDALLVAPITRPGIEHRHVYLPAGEWFQWWTGERVEGPAHVLAHAPLGKPAIYARANAAIPLWPVLQHTREIPDELTLRVFPGSGTVTRTLYEDAGDGDGPYARRTVTCDGRTLSLGAPEGDLEPSRVHVEVMGGGALAVVTPP
jgi:alpha-glucosidase